MAALFNKALLINQGALTGLTDQDHPASAIIFTPSGNIVATDVQVAITELDTEKANLESPSFTGTVTITGSTDFGII